MYCGEALIVYKTLRNWFSMSLVRATRCLVATGQARQQNTCLVMRDRNFRVMSLTTTTTVLGKRKQETYSLHLESSSESENRPKSSKLILVNGSLIPNIKKRYKCLHPGCQKSYAKPSRLEEHERSHTGIVCAALLLITSETHNTD